MRSLVFSYVEGVGFISSFGGYRGRDLAMSVSYTSAGYGAIVFENEDIPYTG